MIIVGLSAGGRRHSPCLINREILRVLQENHVCKEGREGGDGLSRFYIRDNEIVLELSQTSNTPVSQCYLETGKKGKRGLVILKDIIDTLFVSV